MMLANLYRKAGQERSAVTSYKEVLRQCPLALDAIIGMRGLRDPFIQQTTFNLLRHLCLLRSISTFYTYRLMYVRTHTHTHVLTQVLLGLFRASCL